MFSRWILVELNWRQNYCRISSIWIKKGWIWKKKYLETWCRILFSSFSLGSRRSIRKSIGKIEIGSNQLLPQFFHLLPLEVIESFVEITGRRAVENGVKLLVNLPLLLRFIALSVSMSINCIPSFNHYLSNEIGDLELKTSWLKLLALN